MNRTGILQRMTIRKELSFNCFSAFSLNLFKIKLHRIAFRARSELELSQVFSFALQLRQLFSIYDKIHG